MSSELKIETVLNEIPIDKIRKGLLEWWNNNCRSFPWRYTNDPYKILVAEVLLHRTQADQVVPIYELFLLRCPDVHHLAESNEEEVLKILFPIGLHWRNKLLCSMAKEIAIIFNGQVPQELDELKSLSGVSDYIASAVRCFAFVYPDVVLDTNTVRVMGRITGLEISDSSRRSKRFKIILEKFIDTQRPREFNWALIDFAALVCRSKIPIHNKCPLRKYCRFYQAL